MNLEKGYYFVEETLTYDTPKVDGKEVTITSKVKPFIVAVPMTASDGENWLSDVHVYPKNEGLNPEKKPEVPSVNVGDEVKWSVTANIPTDFNDYKRFAVIDELDEKLNFVANSVEVSGIQANGIVVEAMSSPDDFTVEYTPASAQTKEKIIIELTSAGIAKLAANGGAVKLKIDFKTTVNNKINDVENNEVTNQAVIEYENTTTPDGETKTPGTKINTGKVIIKKKNQDGGELAGAKFKLYYIDGTDKYYIYKNTSDELKAVKEGGTVPSGYSLYQIESGADGTATFSGLKTHKSFDTTGIPTDPIEYYIEETKAPNGYNLLNEPVKVSFKDGNEQHVVSKEIINKKGFILPNTGGVGTILLVVAGIVLIGVAIILSMNKKKKTV